MTDSPAEAPADFRPSIVIAPLGFLAAGALVTHLAADAAAQNSHGGWINLSSLTYAIGWMAYLVCATGFVWVDYLFVKRLPDRIWQSAGRMLAGTALAALVGSVAASIAALVLGGAFMLLRDVARTEGLFFVLLALVPLSGVVGLVADLRIRRTARIRS